MLILFYLKNYYNLICQCLYKSNTVPVHIQQIIANFMSSGSFERHLNKMRKIYREKLNYILERLKPHEDQLKIEGAFNRNAFYNNC